MSNFFNARRAANFFVYDLKTAKNNFLLSLVICGLMPAIMFAFAMVVSFLIKQSPAEVAPPLQFLALFVGLTVAVVSFPTKQYGGLTDKRYGSDWLMLPASTFEKWLSVVIVSFVVLPVALFAILFSCDWLLSVIFPALYPQAIITSDLFSTLVRLGGNPSELEELFPHINWGLEIFFSFGQLILYFVLGAVFFKQSKFAKSLLVSFGFSALMLFVLMAVFGTTSFTQQSIDELVGGGDFDEFFRKSIMFDRCIDLLFTTIVAALLYIRIKTLKH